MFGSEVEVLNIPEISNLKAEISSGKLYIEWNWPAQCKQVKVLYSNNSFSDPYKITKSFPKERYEKEQAFVIYPVADKDYYIEVQSQQFDGTQEILSSGVKMIFHNSIPMTIKYELKTSTFLKKKMTLSLENDINSPLPELILVGNYGHLPSRKEEGEIIQIIKQGTKAGNIQLPVEFMRKNFYARLFLADNSIKNIKIITPAKDKLKTF